LGGKRLLKWQNRFRRMRDINFTISAVQNSRA
jgi:hypothetical protein